MQNEKKRKTNQSSTLKSTPDDLQTVVKKLVASFDYFCDNFAYIQDKATHRVIRFNRYPGQCKMSQTLSRGEWLVCLKGRQLGITWLCAEYCLWKMLTCPMFTACVVAQNRNYAKDFLKRVKFIYSKLPDWLKLEVNEDSRYEFSLLHAGGQESDLRVIAGGDAAGRSITANLIIFDEHAYTPYAKQTRIACEPSLEIAKGQAVIISTSAGPYGDFYETYIAGPENGYTPIFLHWSDRPGRDAAWYERRKERYKDNLAALYREYPNTPAEAFSFAEGRCYPCFDPQKHVRNWEQLEFKKEDATLYRAVDFGSVAAFVCIWIAHWPKAKLGFTVSPECPNTIRELLAYHYDPRLSKINKERPAKVDDHVPDALRYLMVGQSIVSGHIHVYRELYILNSSALGRTDLSDIADIHRLSGWEEAEAHEAVRYKPAAGAEQFEITVTDPSLAKSIELYNLNDIDCYGYVRPQNMSRREEVLEGIKIINMFMEGTQELEKTQILNEEQIREQAILRPNKGPLPASSCSLQEAAFRDAARLGLKKRNLESAHMARYRYKG